MAFVTFIRNGKEIEWQLIACIVKQKKRAGLQEQLATDIQVIEDIIGYYLEMVLAKGQNYLYSTSSLLI